MSRKRVEESLQDMSQSVSNLTCIRLNGTVITTK